MKKKFISVAMFSALLISTPVIVGCSDYDDDISNLQGQIDSLKGSDVSSSEALSALNNALNDLKADITTITSGKADNAAVIELQEKVTELTNLINGSGSGEGEIAGLAEQIKDLQEQELIKTFDERLWCSLVDFITVYSKEDIRVTFKDGTEIGRLGKR